MTKLTKAQEKYLRKKKKMELFEDTCIGKWPDGEKEYKIKDCGCKLTHEVGTWIVVERCAFHESIREAMR